MKKTLAILLSAVALAAAINGCSSSSSSGDVPAGCTADGFTGNSSNPACSSCVESSCSSQFSAWCGAGCQTMGSASSCQQPTSDIVSCIETSCASQCNSGAGGSSAQGGSSSTGGSTSTGGSSSTGGTTGTGGSVCYFPGMMVCEDNSSAVSVCTVGGGMVLTSCPTDNLIGCCTKPVAGEVCVYTGSDVYNEMTCTQDGGSWSTTPNP